MFKTKKLKPTRAWAFELSCFLGRMMPCRKKPTDYTCMLATAVQQPTLPNTYERTGPRADQPEPHLDLPHCNNAAKHKTYGTTKG